MSRCISVIWKRKCCCINQIYFIPPLRSRGFFFCLFVSVFWIFVFMVYMKLIKNSTRNLLPIRFKDILLVDYRSIFLNFVLLAKIVKKRNGECVWDILGLIGISSREMNPSKCTRGNLLKKKKCRSRNLSQELFGIWQYYSFPFLLRHDVGTFWRKLNPYMYQLLPSFFLFWQRRWMDPFNYIIVMPFDLVTDT